jgi:hypothetical protein
VFKTTLGSESSEGFRLDVAVEASGFGRRDMKVLEQVHEHLRAMFSLSDTLPSTWMLSPNRKLQARMRTMATMAKAQAPKMSRINLHLGLGRIPNHPRVSHQKIQIALPPEILQDHHHNPGPCPLFRRIVPPTNLISETSFHQTLPKPKPRTNENITPSGLHVALVEHRVARRSKIIGCDRTLAGSGINYIPYQMHKWTRIPKNVDGSDERFGAECNSLELCNVSNEMFT